MVVRVGTESPSNPAEVAYDCCNHAPTGEATIGVGRRVHRRDGWAQGARQCFDILSSQLRYAVIDRSTVPNVVIVSPQCARTCRPSTTVASGIGQPPTNRH
jgi:hypothetical protein